ncbi:hypothetical protein OSB04_020295 [Centaurea solstitialis]|uniref:Protein TIFY n=1 Tax=Centaurea solstitialis TaxID=347529 RepID=A0AA38TAD9_9ASTR|nr:hypothetical protein OSB04_020295 [Centaurea solstitialis]
MTTEESPLSVSTTASILDKPLHLLTEDDISQVTREQCRQYLSQKGMRKPSWNKSQAVQQVIMLKALLEPVPESDGCSRKLHITHRQQEEAPSKRVRKGTSADESEVSVSADESVPGQSVDRSDLPGDDEFVPMGTAGVTEEAKGQMTIFYSGMVNVYDDVPADKLAAIPLQVSQEAPFDGNVTTCPLTCHLQAPNLNASMDSSSVFMPTLQTGTSCTILIPYILNFYHGSSQSAELLL